MRTAARSNRIRTAAGVTAAAVLAGGLPLLTAATAHADEVPTVPVTQTVPAAPAPAKAPAKKKLTKAQKKKLKAKRAKQRANRKRASLVRVALNQKGDQYVAGASGPNAFDCSGFTQYVYKQATGKYLPHYSGSQMHRGKRVSQKNLKPGDLMFYGPGGSQHVSMYIGKGKMIHATNPRTDVRIDSIHNGYWRGRYAGATRIVQG